MRKGSIILGALAALAGLGSTSRQADIATASYAKHSAKLIPQFWYPCRKTVTAAQLKRAAKKRRNIRARSKKK